MTDFPADASCEPLTVNVYHNGTKRSRLFYV
jgi:hypothetical protein